MESNNKHNCKVCESLESTLFLKSFDFFVSKEAFDIKKCTNCGFIFTYNAPSIEKIGSYYKSDAYISHSNTQKGIINKIYHRVRSIMLARKWRLIKKVTPGKELLDIGCGTGHFLNFMKQKGYSTTGIEMDETARNFAIKNFGLEINNPEAALKNDAVKKFDIITLWHVLEHLHESDRYLQWINEALKPNGKLIIALPNYASFDAKYYKQYWAAYDVPRHLWHFSPSSLEKYLNRFNFSLTKIKRLPFDAYYNSMMSANYANKKISFLNGFLAGFTSNFLSFFNTRKASSIIYIFEKSTKEK